MTQNEMILQYIKDTGSVTSLDAIREFGCTRLSARIKDLEDAGYRFKKFSQTSANRYGKKVTFTRYELGGD